MSDQYSTHGVGRSSSWEQMNVDSPRDSFMTLPSSHSSSTSSARPQSMNSQRPNFFGRVVTFCKEHKTAILVALLIIGSTLLTFGIGLAVGASGSALIAVAGPWWFKTAVFTPAAKMLLSGIICMAVGASVVSYSAGALTARAANQQVL